MVKSVAIIGGGVIGGGWAARFLLSGWDVRVFDPGPDAARKLDEVLANARRSVPSLRDGPSPKEGQLSFHETIEGAVKGVSWVQESVPERLGLKLDVYHQIQKANPNVVIGSSTSGFKPSELGEAAINPAKITVAHPFNPVYLLPLVELVPHETMPQTEINEAKAIMDSLGMHPLQVRKEMELWRLRFLFSPEQAFQRQAI